MRPSRPTLAALLLLSAFATSACITDSVQPDIYGPSARPLSADAMVGVRMPMIGPSAGSGTLGNAGRTTDPDWESDTEPATESEPARVADGGANSQASAVAAAPGTCDLSGHWLITQRTIAQGLGVKQAGVWWFYYQLEQSGSDLTVKKGLVCGSQVLPVDVLAAKVEFSASFTVMAEKNSHAGRRGKIAASGANCGVSFERAYSIVGATTPYYADPSRPLPTVDQVASGSTPGWEDWDADGKPAVSLKVSGIVQGTRYTVLRVFSELKGTVAAGATNFKLPVPNWGQEEAVLGVTSELLKQSGVPDGDAKGHFAQFAKLTPEQVQGAPADVCATIRKLAPTLTADANK